MSGTSAETRVRRFHVSKGQRISYVRVSSYDQNPDRQFEHLEVDRVFTDKASGKDADRPQLRALLSYAREGDTIVIHSMDRLARNVDDLRRIVLSETRRGVRIHFIKENPSGVHRDKQNSKPGLPIKRIPRRGESRNLVEIVAHRRCSKLKLELHR